MKKITREQGTDCLTTESAEDKIAAARQIVEQGKYAKVDGLMLDLFSASAICAVYDGLNEENREKFAAMPINKMAVVAFKLLKK